MPATFKTNTVWRKFFWAVLSLFLVASAIYFISEKGQKTAYEWGELINKSGRQRMLSQQILLRVHILNDAVAAADIQKAQQALGDSLTLFKRSHADLLKAAQSLKDSYQLSDALDKAYFGTGDQSLSALMQAFIQYTTQFLQSSGRDQQAFQSLQTMDHALLLRQLDAVVQAFQASSESDARWNSNALLIGYILTCIVLLLEVLFIFVPMNKAILSFAAYQKSSQEQLQRSNESLMTSAEEFKTVIQQMQMAEILGKFGNWRLDLTNNQVSWSDGIYNIHHRPKSKGLPTYEEAVNYYSAESQIIVNNHIATAAKEKSGFTFECDLNTETGDVKKVVSIATYSVINGAPTLVGILRDLTEEKRQEKQLRQMIEKANSRAKSRCDFLAIISHEIKTPITGVMGILEILSNSDLSEEDKKLVTAGVENNKLLMMIVNDILEMSRLETDRIKLLEAPFSPQDAIQNICDLHSISAANKGLTMAVNYCGDPCKLIGDEQRFKQILNNLVSNAIKYTKEGHIDIIATIGDKDQQNMRPFTVAVKDTGIGIPNNLLDDLFIPFEQIEDSYRREQGGTGLGLAIAQRIARLMGGRIDVESELGVGTTFTVSLSLQAAVDETSPALADKKAHPLSPLKLLIAEDMDLNRLLLQKILVDQWGMEVRFAVNGKEAVDLAGRDMFDAIFMDIQMPVMDGIEATKIIRGQYLQHKDTPIFALTANTEGSNIETYFEAGMQKIFSKPIDWDQIKSTLAAISDSKKPG